MIGPAARTALVEAFGDQVRFDVSMSRTTSLGVGGPADALATPQNREQLERLLGLCATLDLPHTILGAGFNILVLDGGIPGVAIQTRRLRQLEEQPGGALRAEAGVSHAQLAKFCTTRGLSGLEFTAGIPGSVGGWVAMNAGIPGSEIKDVIFEVEVMSPTGAQRCHRSADSLSFCYRGLRDLAPGSVIVSALFDVRLASPEVVKAEVQRLLAARAACQPLDVPSCGSVFRNPLGDFAGRLIEAAGLKGATHGAAQISPVHANFISTQRGATAADVVALIELARDAVERSSGIRLEPEVRILGRPA